MSHLSLARAVDGANNISKGLWPSLKCRVQYGRYFITCGSQTLAAGHDWESTLANFLQVTVVAFVNRNRLKVPADAEFNTLAQMYLEDPQRLVEMYEKDHIVAEETILKRKELNVSKS